MPLTDTTNKRTCLFVILCVSLLHRIRHTAANFFLEWLATHWNTWATHVGYFSRVYAGGEFSPKTYGNLARGIAIASSSSSSNRPSLRVNSTARLRRHSQSTSVYVEISQTRSVAANSNNIITSFITRTPTGDRCRPPVSVDRAVTFVVAESSLRTCEVQRRRLTSACCIMAKDDTRIQ